MLIIPELKKIKEITIAAMYKRFFKKFEAPKIKKNS